MLASGPGRIVDAVGRAAIALDVEDYEPGRYCPPWTAVEVRDCTFDTGAGFDVS